MSHEQTHPRIRYGLIFGGLCVLTGLSWAVDEAAKHGFLREVAVIAVLVLAVAAFKAGLVMLYFMHLKFERNWKFVLLAPTVILACGLPLALLPDIGVHYYTVDVPQTSAAEHEEDQAHSGHAPVENAH